MVIFQARLNTGLNSSLAYEIYAGYSQSDQLFFVASEIPSSRHSNHRCMAIDVSGAYHSMSCGKQLPTLCTQSASASISTFADTSTPFRIAQPVREQTLVGYRDFYTFRFLGVRFAQELERFTYSSPFTSAVGTNLALDGAPECPQAPNNGSTDCLFLNIWTPTLPGAEGRTKHNLRPVMVRRAYENVAIELVFANGARRYTYMVVVSRQVPRAILPTTAVTRLHVAMLWSWILHIASTLLGSWCWTMAFTMGTTGSRTSSLG